MRSKPMKMSMAAGAAIVNDALGGEYQRLFAKIDFLVLLAAPSFDVVLKWRTQQEHELREQSGNKSGRDDRCGSWCVSFSTTSVSLVTS